MQNKKKILLIADIPNWIFHRHCIEIQNRLDKFYDFIIIFRDQVNNFKLDFYDSFNVIYILDSRLKIPYNLKHKTIIGIRCEFSYEHTYEGILNYYKQNIENRANVFHVVNLNQFNDFKKIAKIPLFFAPHGVDVDYFNPFEYTDIKNIIIGTNGSKKSKGNKGFEIIEKVCKELKLPLISIYQDFKRGNLNKYQMYLFYNFINVYINLSESEGLNNSILEAGAMGKCVIATNVGNIPELIVNLKNGIITNRTENSLKNKLLYLLKNKEKINEFGINLQKEVIKRYSWNRCIKNYKNMFDFILRFQK